MWYAFVLADALQDSRFNLENFGVCAQSSSSDYKVTCEKIARSISSKPQVFYPGEPRAVSLQCTSH